MDDSVEQGLSELRTSIVGVQILLGLRQEVLLQKSFLAPRPVARPGSSPAFPRLLLPMALMIAPASRHRITERGGATKRADAVGSALAPCGLAVRVLAVSADLFVLVGGGDRLSRPAAPPRPWSSPWRSASAIPRCAAGPGTTPAAPEPRS